MLDLGLPTRIRRKGVTAIEVAGWQTRTASGLYTPRGSVNHHTAGSPNGRVPSLAVCTYGRGQPNPLPETARPDQAYVICSGRANHAGSGSWHGLSGNGSVAGLEVEHTGLGAVPIARLEVSARIQAALLEAPGSSRDAAFCCQHSEWTSRKIDFWNLAPWTVHTFRQRVAYWIGRSAEEDDMTPAELREELKDGESRKHIKTIAFGAVLDGLREPTRTDPDRGGLRGPFKNVLKEAIREMKEDGEL
jgi:hypothetical protein